MANKQMHHLKVGDNNYEIVDSVARSGISGAPSIVSLSSAMIDTDKLYLYIGSETGYTSGDWYYYNGTSWVSGGQYGDMQLDTSLTTSGMAADAKSVGDRFNSFATTATAGQTPIADGSGGWQWGEDSTLYEQIGDNFAYIRDYTELGAFSVTDIDATSDNPNRVRSKVFTINALTQIKTIDPTDMLAVYAEDGNGTVTRIANSVNTVTLTDTSLRYRYTGRTADELAIPVSKIRNFATRNDRNLNLNNRFRDAVAIAVEGGALNIVQDGANVHAEVSSNAVVISNDGYTRITAGTSETFTPTLNQNYIVYTENGEIKVQSNREDSPITPKEAGTNRIFIGLVRSGELYTWVSENVLFNGATPHIIGGGAGQHKGANLMQIFPIYSVIGDSLACGFMNIDGVSVSSANAKAYGNNWVKYLSLRTGRRFNNLAVGGSTTTLWRNTHISTANVSTSAYIIGLGVNDRRQQVTVGTSSDINASDYTQNAVSTYGNLDYIVNKLKEFNPYCHIFMLTIPAIEDTYNLATFGSCEQQNGAIRYVAGLYDNVHLIDLHDVSDYDSELISDTFIANHFNPLSYASMSTLIESTINAYMADNYNLFRTAPYHADGTCEQVSDSGIDASTASEGQVLTADGAGGWQWGDVATSGDSVPTNVRQAILALLQNGVYTRDDMSDEVAAVVSWASEVTSISVSPTTLTINGMEQETIVATTTPAGGIVTWSSSDESIATVSGGVVTPTGVNGSCTITASCGGKSASCNVTVSGFATLVSISAVYTQSGTVYDTDTLDSLKADLVVTASYDNGTTQTVTEYTLSGTLSVGTSTISVAYSGKTATFTVTVSAPSMYDVEYQGNLSTGGTDANRVSLVTKSITFEANGGSHTVSAQSGYLIYPFKEWGANGDASSYNTAAGSNSIYVNARNSGDYIFRKDEVIVETNGVITVPKTRTWDSSWTFTRESSASTIYTPIGFLVKKSDDSALTISEAIEAVTIS